MKKILNFQTLMLLFVAALFMTSCEDEPGGGTGSDLSTPSVTINSETDLTVAPGEEFTVDFSASPDSESPLNAITVYADGTRMSSDRLQFNGVAAAANPILVLGTDKDGLNYIVTITAQEDAGTAVIYSIEANAEDAGKSSADVVVTTVSTPPSLTGFGAAEVDATVGTNFQFKLTGVVGGAQLSTLEVLENGLQVDPASMTWQDFSMMAGGNPFVLSAEEADGFDEGELTIDLPDNEGVFVYTMILEDLAGLRDSVSYVVTTATSGTPIDIREDVLLNAGGPVGTGGLILSTGESVGSDDGDIRDLGIDQSLPSNVNWLQRISPNDDVTMKYVVANTGGTLEGYTFDGVSTKEEVASLFTDNSNPIIDSSASTEALAVGDDLAVNVDGVYYLLNVKEIEIKADNSDRYVFDVKF